GPAAAPVAVKTTPAPVKAVVEAPAKPLLAVVVAKPEVKVPEAVVTTPAKPEVKTPTAVEVKLAPAPQKPATPSDDTELALMPAATQPEAAATVLHPLNMDVSGEGMMVKTQPGSSQPSAPVVPAAAMAFVPAKSPMAVNSMATSES